MQNWACVDQLKSSRPKQIVDRDPGLTRNHDECFSFRLSLGKTNHKRSHVYRLRGTHAHQSGGWTQSVSCLCVFWP